MIIYHSTLNEVNLAYASYYMHFRLHPSIAIVILRKKDRGKKAPNIIIIIETIA